MRINRITGKTEIYCGQWVVARNCLEASEEKSEEKDLTSGELDKISIQFSLPPRVMDYGTNTFKPLNRYSINGNIYNGTELFISEVVIEFILYKDNGEIELKRRYKSTGNGRGFPPLESTSIEIQLGFEINSDSKIDYKVVSAKYREPIKK